MRTESSLAPGVMAADAPSWWRRGDVVSAVLLIASWLFAVLPGTAAWTLNMITTWAVAGLGMFCFLRALRLASLASFLGAFSFASAGACRRR